MRATSRRRAPRGRARGIGNGRHTRPVEAPRDLKAGQLRCPVCRNGVTPTGSGYLRQHRDLFGNTCYNRRPPEDTP